MSYNAKPWLRGVGAAAIKHMHGSELEERGFEVSFQAMRAAYYARHPEEAEKRDAYYARLAAEGVDGVALAPLSTPDGRESDGVPGVQRVKRAVDSTPK